MKKILTKKVLVKKSIVCFEFLFFDVSHEKKFIIFKTFQWILSYSKSTHITYITHINYITHTVKLIFKAYEK